MNPLDQVIDLPLSSGTEHNKGLNIELPRGGDNVVLVQMPEVRTSTEGYHNPRDPIVSIQTERPEHRNVLLLKMQGHSNVEIANLTGYTPVHIATIVKQDWAQEFMARHQNRVGIKKVEMLLDGAVGKAVERLITECDSEAEKSTAMSRIAAARELLDRKFGKAAQPILSGRLSDVTKMSDGEIDARLAELQKLKNSRS